MAVIEAIFRSAEIRPVGSATAIDSHCGCANLRDRARSTQLAAAAHSVRSLASASMRARIAVPREHEARRAANEGVEAPPPCAQLVRGSPPGLRQTRHSPQPAAPARRREFRQHAPRTACAHRLACSALRSHAPLSSIPTHGAERNRIFDASCPACLQR